MALSSFLWSSRCFPRGFIKEKSPVAFSHLSFSKGSHAQQRGVESAFTLTKRTEWKVGRPPCVRGHFRATTVGWGPRTSPHTPCKLGLVRHASWLQIPPRLRLGELWGPRRNSGFASSPPEATGKAGVVPRRHPAPEVPSASAATVPPTSAPPQRSRPSPSSPARPFRFHHTTLTQTGPWAALPLPRRSLCAGVLRRRTTPAPPTRPAPSCPSTIVPPLTVLFIPEAPPLNAGHAPTP